MDFDNQRRTWLPIGFVYKYPHFPAITTSHSSLTRKNVRVGYSWSVPVTHVG